MSARDSTDEPPESPRSGAFVDEPFTAALSRATREQLWLLVNVTDASSPACWTMAQTTWRDCRGVGDHPARGRPVPRRQRARAARRLSGTAACVALAGVVGRHRGERRG